MSTASSHMATGAYTSRSASLIWTPFLIPYLDKSASKSTLASNRTFNSEVMTIAGEGQLCGRLMFMWPHLLVVGLRDRSPDTVVRTKKT
jgi:hypothetical protein